MNTLEKIFDVLVKNVGYTVVLIVAIILFAYFSDGLIPGAITALSALTAYSCIVMLYKEYKKEPKVKAAPAKAADAVKTDSVKKPAAKPAAKKATQKKTVAAKKPATKKKSK